MPSNMRLAVKKAIKAFTLRQVEVCRYFAGWKEKGLVTTGDSSLGGQVSFGQPPFVVNDGLYNYAVLTAEGLVEPLPFGFRINDSDRQPNVIIQSIPASIGGPGISLIRFLPIADTQLATDDQDALFKSLLTADAWEGLQSFIERLPGRVSEEEGAALTYLVAGYFRFLTSGMAREFGISFAEITIVDSTDSDSRPAEVVLAVILEDTDLMDSLWREVKDYFGAEPESDEDPDDDFANDCELDGLEVRGNIYYEIGADERFTGVGKCYWPGGQPKKQEEFKDGKHHGRFESWYENGEREIRGSFDDGQPHGIFKEWDEDARLLSSIRIVHGEPVDDDSESPVIHFDYQEFKKSKREVKKELTRNLQQITGAKDVSKVISKVVESLISGALELDKGCSATAQLPNDDGEVGVTFKFFRD